MVSIHELPKVYISDCQSIGKKWMRYHKRNSRKEMNVRAMLLKSFVENEEFLVPYHLLVNRVSECVSAHVESRKMR